MGHAILATLLLRVIWSSICWDLT